MDIEDQFELGHLFLAQRTCRSCGQTKDLLDGFYLTRKSRGSLPSAYSYECKVCTIDRDISSHKYAKILSQEFDARFIFSNTKFSDLHFFLIVWIILNAFFCIKLNDFIFKLIELYCSFIFSKLLLYCLHLFS